MKDRNKDAKDKRSELLRRAELGAAEKPLGIPDVSALSPEKVQQLIHELQVHQIELEMQNDELRESEELYRLLFERGKDAVVIHDIESMRFVDANPASEALWGYTKSELMTMTPMDLSLEPDKTREALEQAAKPGGTQVSIRWQRKKDGSSVAVEISASLPFTWKNRNVLYSIVRDITKRKKGEDALRESEALYRDLVENIEDLVCKHDLQGNLIFVNSSSANLLGYGSADLVGTNLRSYLAPEVRDQFDAYLAAIQKDGCASGLMLIQTKTGEKRIWEYRNTLRRESVADPMVLGIARDVTDRKRAEEALRESEERYRAVVDNIEAGISLLNANMEIVEVNRAFKEYFPHVRPGCGQLCYEQYNDPPRQSPCSYCPCVVTLQDGEVHEAITETPSGSEIRYYHLISSPIKDSEGKVQYVIELTKDITNRKRAEETLRLSEERYRRLFEDAPLMYVITRNERGSPFISDCNELFLSSVGYTREQVQGKPLTDFYSPESRAELLERGGYARALAGEFFIGERQLLTHDGRLIPTLLYTATEMDPSGQVIGTRAMFVDITERKQAEEALHESVELMQYIVRNDPNAIAVYDRDLHYLAVSNRYLLDYNVREEDIVGKHHYEVFPEMPQRWKDVHQRCLLGAVESEDDDYFERPDGSITYNRWECRPWYRSSGEIGGIITYTEVTTERKMAEKALKESEARYRHLFDNSPVGIISVDTEGRILEVNQTLLDILGSPSAEATRRINMFELPQLVESGVSDAFRSCMTTGERALKEFPYVSKCGKQSHLRIVLTPVTNQERTIRSCQATVEDITQQRALEEQLRQAQKMEAVGTLAGGIAHDFNNLLTVVLGFSELLLTGKDERDPSYEDLQKIHQAARSGADLVKSILAFGRKATINPRPLELNHEIKQVRQLLTRTIPKMIEVKLVLSDDLATVNADPVQVEQILVNLAVNASDSMPDGGQLIIKTENTRLDDEYCMTHIEANPGDYALISVSDTGHGMDEQTLNHIFEPFFTTKEKGRGTGLGLATVYGIVRQHGGHVACDSKPGLGTTFKIYLPVIKGEPKLTAPIDEKGLLVGKETVLLVDDEEMVRDLGKRILERSGYTVLSAANGQEALQLYKREQGRISLVILDLIMPQMGGKECLEELLTIEPRVKVLIATGYAAEGQTKDTIETGARGFVGKPYDMKQMLQAVREVLDEE